MSIKVNALATGPRITIDVNPDGSSKMKVRGNLTMPVVCLILSNQLNTLLPTMFTEMFKLSTGLTKPNGQPIAVEQPVMKTEPDEEPETEPEKIQ